VKGTGVRRVRALVYGLPQDAAIWRADGWPDREELLATLVEVVERWGLVHANQLQGSRYRQFPERVQIPRPGTRAPTERTDVKVTRDLSEVGAWLATH
jgi:hypothetical protein